MCVLPGDGVVANVECLCSSWGNGESMCVCSVQGVVVAVGCLCSSWGWGSCECGMFLCFLG